MENKMEQIKNIKNGKGIQYILDEAYKILGNPILTHDMDYKVIAYTENTTEDDPIFNEFTSKGMVGRDRLIFYRDECFLEMAANAKKVTFLLSDKLKYDRIYGKLFTKNNIQIGCACMVACYKPFEDNDAELFEIVCDILTEESCESEFYQQYGQEYMETLTGQLIEDKIEDKELYTAHVESIYIGLKRNLHLIVADIAQYDTSNTKLIYLRNLLKELRPDFKYVIYSNYILIIASSNKSTFNMKKDLNEIHSFFEQNNIYSGVSSCFENIFDLPKQYTKAVNMLLRAKKNYN